MYGHRVENFCPGVQAYGAVHLRNSRKMVFAGRLAAVAVRFARGQAACEAEAMGPLVPC